MRTESRENTGQRKHLFLHILLSESQILFLDGKKRVRERTYAGIIYAVIMYKSLTGSGKLDIIALVYFPVLKETKFSSSKLI